MPEKLDVPVGLRDRGVSLYNKWKDKEWQWYDGWDSPDHPCPVLMGDSYIWTT